MAMQQIYTGIDEDGNRVFQSQAYIEDGWYIVELNGFQVWEIPQYGGEPHLEGTFKTFGEAFDFTDTLT